MRGMVNDMLRDGIRNLPGHVQVHEPGFLDDPGIDKLIDEPRGELEARFRASGVTDWASRIRVPAVVTSEQESRGVTLFGIDPGAERDISFVAASIADGRNLADAADDGAVIGLKLADVLETGLGKRIVIMSQDPHNEIADRGFRVVGLFDASLDVQEESAIFIGRTAVQDMLGTGDRVNEIVVQGNDYRNVAPLLEEVRQVAGPGLEVLPWYELDHYLGSMMNVMDGFVLVWMIVIFLALSFGLVNTLVMAVFERVREIGLMLALGMRPSSILGQVVIESLLLLSIGLVAGNVLAWASVVPLTDGINISIVAEGMEMFGAASVLYPELTARDVLLANAVVVGLGILASLSPAWRASRYQPIEAITKV